ncbi:PaaI family thioesterase [uncultured Algimonas sp.]|uniref:PaaI family thioesterase n=1 Tax=uncultured Algimonas sp. TaxID=1547920 RepID=UPI0026315A1A|nr:PaaI family thioesterase [uncultured Algimonas sp.]
MDMDERLKLFWEVGAAMIASTPHATELGIQFVAVGEGQATLSLPYSSGLVGDAKTRVLHGGAVTTLLDQACGLAAFTGFDTMGALATLSLRIDYQRAAKPDQTIIGTAECYKTTTHVAFLRALAHDGDESDPVATAQATFMSTGPRLSFEDAIKARMERAKRSKAGTRAP